MKKINLRKVLSLAISLLMVFSVFACIPASAEDAASVVTVLQDGSTVGWSSESYYNTAPDVKDVAEGKSVVAVYPMPTGDHMIDTASMSLTAAGITDTSTLNTLSMYFKNPGKVDLRFYIGHGNWQHALGTGTYYLVASDNSDVKKVSSWEITIPAGFDGYIIFDAKSCAYWTDYVAYLANGSLVLWTTNNADMYGNAWYYSEIAVSTATPAEVAAYYVEGASLETNNFVLQNNSGAPSWCWGGTAAPTTVNDKNVLSVTGTGAWVDFSTNAANLTEAGISKDAVNAISIYVNNPVENGAGDMALWDYLDAHSYKVLTNITATLYDINEETAVTVYTEDILGGIKIPAGFEGYVIYDVESTRKAGALGTFFDCDLAHPVIFSANSVGAMYYADYTVWTSSYADVLNEMVPEVSKFLLQNNSGIPSWCWTNWDASAVATPTTINSKNALAVTGSFVPVHISQNVANLGAAGISSDAVNAISLYVNNPAENGAGDMALWDYQDAHGWYPLTNITVTLYDLNEETAVTVSTEDGLGVIKIPAGFEGYVIYDVESTRKAGALGTFFDCDLAHLIILSASPSKGTMYYADYTVWTKDSKTVLEKLSEGNCSMTAGDINGDNNVDILDFIRFKKYFAGIECLINSYNADVDGNSSVEPSDLISVKKLLLGITNAQQPEAENNEIGMSIFHLGYGAWDEAYATTYGEENSFLNFYTTTSIYTLEKLVENKNQAWYLLNGNTIFTDETNPTAISEGWKNEISINMAAFEKYGVDSAVAGFLTEEWDATLTNEQLEVVYGYLNETYPEMRIFAVLTVESVNGSKALSPDAYVNVTDVAYDYYYSTDIELHRTYTNTMKAAVSADTRIWYFPLSSNLHYSHTPEFVLAHINTCYELLNEQENKGGLFFYNWQTFEEANHTGLDNLGVSYSAVYERIVEIGKEILG